MLNVVECFDNVLYELWELSSFDPCMYWSWESVKVFAVSLKEVFERLELRFRGVFVLGVLLFRKLVASSLVGNFL